MTEEQIDSIQRRAFKTGVRKLLKDTKKKAVKKIGVGYKVNWIRELDSKNATFKADFKLFYYWQDDFFKGGKKGAHLDVRAPGAFWPDLIIANEAELHITHEDFYLRDPATGAVKLSQYYRGTMTVINMNLRYFPFDIQNLRICVRPHKATIREVGRRGDFFLARWFARGRRVPTMKPLSRCGPRRRPFLTRAALLSRQVELTPADDHAIEYHCRHEWNVVGHCTHSYATNPTHSTTGKVYSCLHVIVIAQREHSWYLLNILVPNGLLVVVNLSVFLMETRSVGERTETSVGGGGVDDATTAVVGGDLPPCGRVARATDRCPLPRVRFCPSDGGRTRLARGCVVGPTAI